jgi:hypothetical protein
MDAIAAMPDRVPLVMSGDLHAVGIGRMLRSGKLDFAANPINAVLTGPIGTGRGWPSARRGTGALPPAHLDIRLSRPSSMASRSRIFHPTRSCCACSNGT